MDCEAPRLSSINYPISRDQFCCSYRDCVCIYSDPLGWASVMVSPHPAHPLYFIVLWLQGVYMVFCAFERGNTHRPFCRKTSM